MTLLIFQILAASFSLFAFLSLSTVLYFLLRTNRRNRVIRPKALVLSVLLIVTFVNMVYSSYAGGWMFTVYKGVYGLSATFIAGCVFMRLPIYRVLRRKIVAFLEVEPPKPPQQVLPETVKEVVRETVEDVLPFVEQEESVPITLSSEQEKVLEELLNDPQKLCNREFTCKDYAKAIGVDRTYLNRCFENKYGMNCSKYLTSLRLDMAEKILLETDTPVLDICDKIGFKSPSSLFGLFKTRHGMSPSQWKKLMTERFAENTNS